MHGEIPGDWKSANVFPIFRNGSKGDKNNYRPVSLTYIIRKLLESIIRNQVEKFLDTNKLIYSSEHGFTKGKSCLTILIKFWLNLGPLFTIFFDEIVDEVLCKISKFAEDTKIASWVDTFNDIRSMQRNLDKLVAWANRWDVELKVNKYEVMLIRKRNASSRSRKFSYRLENVIFFF